MAQKGPTLLVVDDDPEVLDVVDPCARDLGFHVERHRGGGLTEALNRVTPDVVMVNLQTPEGAIDALHRIRRIRSSCAVILISSELAVDRVVEAIKCGASDYLVKPLDEGRVRRRLSEVRDGRDGEPARRDESAPVERRARAEQQFADTLLDSLPGVVYVYDQQGLLLRWSRGVERVSGYSHDELRGMHFLHMIPEERRRHMSDRFAEVLEKGEATTESWLRAKDGRVTPFFFTGRRVVIDGNRCVVGMGIDISEQREAEQALRASEERMRFVLQNAAVATWDVDHAAGAVRWSETLEAQWGMAPGSFRGTREELLERIHPDDRDSVLDTVEKARHEGGDFSALFRVLRPDGAVRWLSSVGRVLLDALGQPARSVGISLDVTERRALEAQYQQAQKMEAVGQLAGGVAHDFNNLLTAILGYCELLLSDIDAGDPRRSDVAEIRKAGTRAAALTRQLLAFSRKQVIQPTSLDLNVVVSEMREMLGRLIGDNIAIVVHAGDGLALVRADRGQVEQIVMNLAVNARDAMARGGTLTIETANLELRQPYTSQLFSTQPGSYVALTVSDTGTGIAPEVQARMFEPFFTTKPVGKGTGLGLATVHGIVVQSGASIWVESEIGKGSSFTVCFPKCDVDEVVANAPVPAARPHGSGETVLVVDDAEELRELTTKLLERQGYRVLVAADAREALRRFEQNDSIDVMLTDVVMPGTSGPELTRQLSDRQPQLKVIYMSGHREDEILDQGGLKNGVAFLHKPFSSDALGRKIREVLDR
jgi:two-component system, cell cycle sensor histidine kinase and response regulator CckA